MPVSYTHLHPPFRGKVQVSGYHFKHFGGSQHGIRHGNVVGRHVGSGNYVPPDVYKRQESCSSCPFQRRTCRPAPSPSEQGSWWCRKRWKRYRAWQDRIIVELPGVKDPDKAIAMLGRTALLEFKDVSATRLTPSASPWSASLRIWGTSCPQTSSVK